ncbi:MAG TPA: LLM class flavin-dependent oxidoreductase [Thermomicrobiaceae bacterium]|nr:LLM class flavin-dependent oxidoreductase [Thermomicrobiaceae bacterium]
MAGPTNGKNPPGNELHFGILTQQEWRSWDEMQEQWQWAEETGWDSAWAYDHFFSLQQGEMGPCLDGWTLLAGLLARTRRLQAGLMVTGLTHRYPAVLFKQAVTVDVISGGRLILGIGAAWNEREHRAYGIPFPPDGERVDRFGEAMAMLRLLETEERTTFHGDHYQLEEAPFEPKPVFGHIPLLIGSTGRRMLRHVARYADQWDGEGSPEEYARHSRRLDDACREIGRDPAEIRRVLSTRIEDVASTEDEFRRWAAGYTAIGVRTFIIHVSRGGPSPALRAIAERVMPDLRAEFAAREPSGTRVD